MDNQNIKSTFSPKSDLALAEIIKKYNLNNIDVKFLIEKLTMFFSRKEISDEEMTNSIQKESGVSQEVAEQIALEIKNTLIPTLWNNLSQKDKESLLHTRKQTVEETEEIMPENIPMAPDIKKRLNNKSPKKSTSEPLIPTVYKKSSKTDKYREPTE